MFPGSQNQIEIKPLTIELTVGKEILIKEEEHEQKNFRTSLDNIAFNNDDDEQEDQEKESIKRKEESPLINRSNIGSNFGDSPLISSNLQGTKKNKTSSVNALPSQNEVVIDDIQSKNSKNKARAEASIEDFQNLHKNSEICSSLKLNKNSKTDLKPSHQNTDSVSLSDVQKSSENALVIISKEQLEDKADCPKSVKNENEFDTSQAQDGGAKLDSSTKNVVGKIEEEVECQSRKSLEHPDNEDLTRNVENIYRKKQEHIEIVEPKRQYLQKEKEAQEDGTEKTNEVEEADRQRLELSEDARNERDTEEFKNQQKSEKNAQEEKEYYQKLEQERLEQERLEQEESKRQEHQAQEKNRLILQKRREEEQRKREEQQKEERLNKEKKKHELVEKKLKNEEQRLIRERQEQQRIENEQRQKRIQLERERKDQEINELELRRERERLDREKREHQKLQKNLELEPKAFEKHKLQTRELGTLFITSHN